MKLKKLGATILAGSLAVSLLAACGAKTGAADSKNFTVWAGGSDNVRIQMEKQIEQFNKSNKDGFVAKLEFIVSGTGTQSLRDRVIAAKKADQKNTDFDVVEMGEDEVQRYVDEGGDDLLLKLDTAKIPNLSNLKFKSTFQADKVVPYRGTTVVLAYNKATVSNPPKTTEELYKWIKDNPGRFAYNTPDSGGAGSSFVLTSVYNFLPAEALVSNDAKWEAEWGKGLELLKELHPSMYKSSGKVVYPNKNQGTLDLLANKEIDMAPAWADMVLSQKKAGTMPADITITQLSPSFTGSTVVFGIPSIGKNSAGAHAWINYMISPEAQNIALDSMAAIPVIDFKLLDQKLTETISDLKIESFRLNSIGDLSTKLNEKWTSDIATLP